MATTALICSATTVTTLVISPRTAERKFPHQEHLITTIDCSPTHVMIATAEADLNLTITDATKETTSTGQNHTISLNVTETSVTTRNMHPTLYPATIAACDTQPLTDALGDTPTGIPNTITAKNDPQPSTLHA